MNVKNTIIKKVVFWIIVVLIFFSIASLIIIVHQKNENTYTTNEELMSFFEENRTLFETIKDDFYGMKGWIDENGYICYIEPATSIIDEPKEPVKKWVSGLSKNAKKYYEISQFPGSSINSEIDGVKFEFYYSENNMIVGFLYAENSSEKYKENYMYKKISDNWYFFELAMT